MRSVWTRAKTVLRGRICNAFACALPGFEACFLAGSWRPASTKIDQPMDRPSKTGTGSFAALARPKLVSIIEKFGIFMVISCEANHFSGVLWPCLERGTQKLPDFNHLVLCWPIDYIDLCLEPNCGRHDAKRNEPDCWLLRLRGVAPIL